MVELELELDDVSDEDVSLVEKQKSGFRETEGVSSTLSSCDDSCDDGGCDDGGCDDSCDDGAILLACTEPKAYETRYNLDGELKLF